MENINLFDIITISLILILGIKGIINGLIKEVFVLAGLIGGVFIASRTSHIVGEFINQNILHLENKSSLTLIGFVAVLVGVWLLSIIISSLVKKMVDLSGLGFLDRILGFMVGSAKIFFIISIIIYAISSIQMARKNLSQYLDNSIMYPIMVDFGSYIIKIDTDKISDTITSKFDNTEQTVPNETNSSKPLPNPENGTIQE